MVPQIGNCEVIAIYGIVAIPQSIIVPILQIIQLIIVYKKKFLRPLIIRGKKSFFYYYKTLFFII
jgi:hypothetical protein